MASVRVIIGSGGAAAQVAQQQLPVGDLPRASQPPGGVTARSTHDPERGKYPAGILNIFWHNGYANDLQGRNNTLQRVVSLEVVVSDIKTVGGLALERSESCQRKVSQQVLRELRPWWEVYYIEV